jgi:hypothetical protein
VTEVDAAVEQLANGYYCHGSAFLVAQKCAGSVICFARLHETPGVGLAAPTKWTDASNIWFDTRSRRDLKIKID